MKKAEKRRMKYMKKSLASVLVVVMICSLFLSQFHVEANDAIDDGITLIACSDFQNPNGNEAGQEAVKRIIASMEDDGITSADGFFCCGDYDYEYTETEQGITALKEAVSDVVTENMIFVQGNHDSAIGTAVSGNNDPASGDYGVFVINEDDYMQLNNNEGTIKCTAQNLVEYLNGKISDNYDKPIFVLSHLPLHYTMRTKVNGDGTHANYIFDVLNEAGEKGLNIIFLYGHDHSNGWDDYLGGAAVYLEKDDNIQIAQNSSTVFKTETLNFTYMNAGYVGYYENQNSGSETSLTMTAFHISDDEVTITRYDEETVHDLKSVGVLNSSYGEDAYLPNEEVYTSPQNIPLTSVTDTTPLEDVIEREELDKTLTSITFSDFSIPDAVYTRVPWQDSFDISIEGSYKEASLNGTVFNGDVTYSEDITATLCYAGKNMLWFGLRISNNADGNLEMHDCTGNYGFGPIVFDSTVAGTDLVGKKINLKLSMQYIDHDQDGAEDDVKLGVWFNDVLYNNEYIYLDGYAELLGNYAGIYCERDEATLEVASVEKESGEDTEGEAKDFGTHYTRITSADQLTDGGRYLLVYKSSLNYLMLPQVVTKQNPSGSARQGFELEESSAFGASIVYGDYAEKEWIFTKTENGWLVGDGENSIKLTSTANMGITATLEENGNVFTVEGTDTFTFSSGDYVLNYNSRGLINGYQAGPADYYIYAFTGYSICVTDGLAYDESNNSISVAKEGTAITLQANEAPEGKEFDRWIVEFGDVLLENENIETTTFTMPSTAVKLVATYKDENTGEGGGTEQGGSTGEGGDTEQGGSTEEGGNVEEGNNIVQGESTEVDDVNNAVSPKTGDNSNLLLWIVVLIVFGYVVSKKGMLHDSKKLYSKN